MNVLYERAETLLGNCERILRNHQGDLKQRLLLGAPELTLIQKEHLPEKLWDKLKSIQSKLKEKQKYDEEGKPIITEEGCIADTLKPMKRKTVENIAFDIIALHTEICMVLENE
jgi:ribosome-interacting GTPase 1